MTNVMRPYLEALFWRALSYFEDGNVADLPEAAKQRLREAVCGVDVESLPSVGECEKGYRLQGST